MRGKITKNIDMRIYVDKIMYANHHAYTGAGISLAQWLMMALA